MLAGIVDKNASQHKWFEGHELTRLGRLAIAALFVLA